MKTIALYNIKGGVGKTAGCANLAYLAASDDARTLIWDLDPQGSSTYYFQVEEGLRRGVGKLLSGSDALSEVVADTEFENLWLIPADIENRHLDEVFSQGVAQRKKLKSLTRSVQSEYDYLFIDCPPGIGPLSEAVFNAADVVLMPTIPTTLSMRTWNMALEFFEKQKLDTNKLLGYFSMADVRKTMHSETITSMQRNKQFLNSYIPYLSTVEKMGTELAPVTWFAPSSYAAQCFRNLWKELKKRIN